MIYAFLHYLEPARITASMKNYFFFFLFCHSEVFYHRTNPSCPVEIDFISDPIAIVALFSCLRGKRSTMACDVRQNLPYRDRLLY
jgi:hypothetical protein